MSDEISYAAVVESLAPCGIDCARCVYYEEGTVRRLAVDLSKALEGFGAMASKVSDRISCLSGYPEFAEVLSFLAGVSCAGCREGGSALPFCATRTCHREMGVEFCFQCAEYPCERNQYPENLRTRWRAINDRMRDVGPEEYYRESLSRPRY
ncbi:MAG: DUF3795 domain-containing protein [Actinobacteria bacterium]|nr:DUF3795 domain-containing protein [Actinomycetota bacterium]